MAVSEDGEPGNQPLEIIDDHVGVSLTPNSSRTSAAKRQALHDQERRLLDQGSHAFGWMRDSTAGTFWSRLNGVDFMNSSLQFAALTVLCLSPFLIIVSAESGGDARHALVARLGLDQRAAQDVNELMSSGRHAVTTLSIVGAAVVFFGAMGGLGVCIHLGAVAGRMWIERGSEAPGDPAELPNVVDG